MLEAGDGDGDGVLLGGVVPGGVGLRQLVLGVAGPVGGFQLEHVGLGLLARCWTQPSQCSWSRTAGQGVIMSVRTYEALTGRAVQVAERWRRCGPRG